MRKIIRLLGLGKLYRILSNNIFINTILVLTKLDAALAFPTKQWEHFKYDPNKTAQMNAGFAHRPDEEEALQKVKTKLTSYLEKYVPKKSHVLDLGCGPGLYMQLLDNDYIVDGTDVSPEMLNAAAQVLPNSKLFLGDFMQIKFSHPYQAIYSIGVLQLIPASLVEAFFKKCYNNLNDNGILFIQYAEATSLLHLFYPDRNYNHFSPKKINKIAANYFDILYHKQSFDERIINLYDSTPYSKEKKMFKDGCILIAKKKK